MTIEQVIKNAIPDATKSEMVYILWFRTPFPCGSITARSLYKAAPAYLRAYNNDVKLCEWCHNKVDTKTLCSRCQKALKEVLSE